MAPIAPPSPGGKAWHDLRAGMVAFFDRDSFLQNAGERFGDPWRHAGIVAEFEGELCFIGFGPRDRANATTIPEAKEKYDLVGVVVLEDECDADALAAWAVAQLEVLRRYPRPAIVTSAALSMVRAAPEGPAARLGLYVLAAVAAGHGVALQVLSLGRPRHMCSTFVLAGFTTMGERSEGGGRMPGIDLLRPKSSSCHSGSSRLGRWLAWWFATPSDIWRAFPADRRFLLVDPVPAIGALADGKEAPDGWSAREDRRAA